MKIIIIMLIIITSLYSNSYNNKSITSTTGKLEIFASLDQAVGNIAYTDKGELVFSHHPFFKPKIRVAKYEASTKAVLPFPNLKWNTPTDVGEDYLDEVLGIRSDTQGIVWMIDMGTRNNITPKVVGWNTKINRLERIYKLDKVTIKTSQPQDLVIDYTHGVMVIADEDIARGGDASKAVLLVIDMKTGEGRRILEGHETTRPDRNMPIVVDGKTLGLGLGNPPLYVGADCITLDKNDEWLYYGPLNGNKIYRVRMTDIIDKTLDDKTLGDRVEIYSSKRNNGGLSIDVDNNLYITDIETHSIGFVNSDEKKLSVFASHKKMLWPDGVSYNKDGYMYVGASQIHLGMAFNNGKDLTTKPFYIFRFKPLREGIFGR